MGLVLGVGRVALRSLVELLDRACELVGFHATMLAARGEPVSPRLHLARVRTPRSSESTIVV